MWRNPAKVTKQFILFFNVMYQYHVIHWANKIFLGSTIFYWIFNNWSNRTSAGKKKNNNNRFFWGSRTPMGPPTSNPFNHRQVQRLRAELRVWQSTEGLQGVFLLTLPHGELWRSPFLVLGVVAGVFFFFAPNRLLTFQIVWSYRDHEITHFGGIKQCKCVDVLKDWFGFGFIYRDPWSLQQKPMGIFGESKLGNLKK